MMKSFALSMTDAGVFGAAADTANEEILVDSASAGERLVVSSVALCSIILALGVIVDEIAKLVEGLVNVRKVVFDTSTSAVMRWSVRMFRRSMSM